MRHDRRLRSLTALGLVALLGVLGTGMPSHHHEAGPATSDAVPDLQSADHHEHGTRLIDPDQRVPATGIDFVVSPPLANLLFPTRVEPVDPPRSTTLRPVERAPPSVAPRAPPFPA